LNNSPRGRKRREEKRRPKRLLLNTKNKTKEKKEEEEEEKRHMVHLFSSVVVASPFAHRFFVRLVVCSQFGVWRLRGVQPNKK
jgi:hypothetical protein